MRGLAALLHLQLGMRRSDVRGFYKEGASHITGTAFFWGQAFHSL